MAVLLWSTLSTLDFDLRPLCGRGERLFRTFHVQDVSMLSDSSSLPKIFFTRRRQRFFFWFFLSKHYFCTLVVVDLPMSPILAKAINKRKDSNER